MTTTTRRRFFELFPLAGVSLLSACSDKASVRPTAAPVAAEPAPSPPVAVSGPPSPSPVMAGAAMPMVDEKDPTAVSLGYVADASRADAAKYKTYTAGSACANCALFAGKSGDTTGPCPLFGGRQVSAKGWCSAHAKKPA